MAKNLSIVAQGISGDEGHLLGYNVSDNGIYTPAIGDVVRGTTATYVAQDGLIKTAPPNVARVDYTNGVAELLLEPTSTNLVTYSEDFSQGYWVKQSSSVVANQSTSPNGTNNAFLYNSTSNTFNFLQAVQSVSTLDFFTFSVFVKKGTANGTRLSLSGSAYTNARNVEFDLVNGTFTETSSFTRGTIKELSNGWYLCSVGGVPDTLGSLNCRIQAIGDNNNSNIYIWGSQFEKSQTPSSYIPTNGATSTRSADSLTNFGSSQIIDSDSGILFFEGSTMGDGYNFVRLKLKSSTDDYRLGFSGSGARATQYGGADLSFALDRSQNQKLVLRYNSQNPNKRISLFVNGIEVDASGTVASFSEGLDTLEFNAPNGLRIRQAKHLPYNTDISTL